MIEWLMLVVAVSIFFLCIFLHELGHRKMAWHLGYDADIRWEKTPGKLLPDIVTVWENRCCKQCSDEHERRILLAGLLAGFVPLFFMVWLFDYFGFLVLMNFILYYIVSRRDIARYLEIVESEEDEL